MNIKTSKNLIPVIQSGCFKKYGLEFSYWLKGNG